MGSYCSIHHHPLLISALAGPTVDCMSLNLVSLLNSIEAPVANHSPLRNLSSFMVCSLFLALASPVGGCYLAYQKTDEVPSVEELMNGQKPQCRVQASESSREAGVHFLTVGRNT